MSCVSVDTGTKRRTASCFPFTCKTGSNSKTRTVAEFDLKKCVCVCVCVCIMCVLGVAAKSYEVPGCYCKGAMVLHQFSV